MRGRQAVAALAAAILVVSLFGAPGRAAATSERAVDGWYESAPAVAEDAAGHLAVAWEHWGTTDSGIRFASDATGSWVTQVVSTGADWRPDLVLDGNGKAHVVFARRGAGGGLYYATNATGSWTTTLLRSDAGAWSPSIRIDAAGKLHVVAPSEGFAPGLWYHTNASGSWTSARLSTNLLDSEPSLAITPAGKLMIAFARYEPDLTGIYVMSNATGAWVTTRVSYANYDDLPSLQVDAAGKAHMAYLSIQGGTDSLWYATNASGPWVNTEVLMTGEPGTPVLGLDATGHPEIVVGSYATNDVLDTLHRRSGVAMATDEVLLDPTGASSGYPDIVRDGSGRLTIAYRNARRDAGVHILRKDPDTDVLIAATERVEAPDLESFDGGAKRYLAFQRDAPEGDGTSLAVDEGSGWASGVVDPGFRGRPDLSIALRADHADRYIASGARMMQDTGTGWTAQDLQAAATSPSLSLPFFPSAPSTGVQPVVVYDAGFGAGLRLRERGNDAPIPDTGQAHDQVARSTGSGVPPSLVLAYGMPTSVNVRSWQAATDPGLGAWSAANAVDTWANVAPFTVGLAVTQASGVFVAYDRVEAPGIYVAHADTAAGPWARTRLTRSYADFDPVVATTPAAGAVQDVAYVAWLRACWGPSPGIYLASNRTGSWVTRKVLDGCDPQDVSISTDGQVITIAYTDNVRGIVLLRDAGALLASAASPDASSQPDGSSPSVVRRDARSDVPVPPSAPVGGVPGVVAPAH